MAKRVLPDMARRALRTLEVLQVATVLADLRVPPWSRRHARRGDRVGPHAIADNDQWRSCCRFEDGDACDVEFCDYHWLEQMLMSVPNTRPLERRSIHPGEMLRVEFLAAYGPSVKALAEAAGVSRQSMNELLRERRALSPEMALRLAKLFATSPEYWLNLQGYVDFLDAAQELKREIAQIHPLQVA